jgi:hypothetical protein
MTQLAELCERLLDAGEALGVTLEDSDQDIDADLQARLANMLTASAATLAALTAEVEAACVAGERERRRANRDARLAAGKARAQHPLAAATEQFFERG